MVAMLAQPTLIAPDAETVVLELCRVLVGDGDKDRGLMTHMVNGAGHLEQCQIGMWIQAGDSLRGGQPCSARCLAVQAALRQAGLWLKAQEALPLFGTVPSEAVS